LLDPEAIVVDSLLIFRASAARAVCVEAGAALVPAPALAPTVISVVIAVIGGGRSCGLLRPASCAWYFDKAAEASVLRNHLQSMQLPQPLLWFPWVPR
jgi:hypothetical protein